MATRATYAALGMRRTLKVRMRASVAAQAGFILLFGSHLGELLNLGYVAAAFDMGLARSVAAFARRALATMLQRELGMWVRAELFGNLGMAGRADIRTDKIGLILSACFCSYSRLLVATRRVNKPGLRKPR